MADDDLWTDDEIVRGALMTLGGDVDALDLATPEELRGAASAQQNRRRLWTGLAVAATVLAVAAAGLLRLGSPQALEPVPAGTPTAVSSPTPPSATSSPTEAPSSTSTPTAVTTSACGAVPGTVQRAGLPEPAAVKAQLLMDLAVACDSSGLAEWATSDQTLVSFADLAPADVFSLPDNADRYRALSLVLAMPPTVDTAQGVVEWPQAPTTDAEWQEHVDLGLLDARDVDIAKAEGGGYPGYRVEIALESGVWYVMVAGD